MTTMRECRKCGEAKTQEEFRPSEPHICRDCILAKERAYDAEYFKRPEVKERKRRRQQRQTLPERRECRRCGEAKTQEEFRPSEPHICRDCILAKERAYDAEYFQRPEVKERERKRRRQLRQTLLERQGFLCPGRSINPDCKLVLRNDSKTTEIDHSYPRSRGGADNLDNLQAMCEECNSSKSNMTMEEWRESLRSLAPAPVYMYPAERLLTRTPRLVALRRDVKPN